MKVARCHARSNWENSQPPALLAKTDWNETTNVFASWNSNSTNRLSGYDLENQYAGQKLTNWIIQYSVTKTPANQSHLTSPGVTRLPNQRIATFAYFDWLP